MKLESGDLVAKNEKRVTVFLFGGLGNQLFQYFAGLAVAEAVGAKLYLKPFGRAASQGSDCEIGINAFDLEATVVTSKLPIQIQDRVLPRLINFARRFSLQNFAWSSRTLLTDDIDFDTVNLEDRQHIQLVGYFQNSKYLDFLAKREIEINLSLKNSSVWFQEFQARARVKKPIIVHLRRGDYLNYADTIGVLDFQFFLNALQLIPHFSEPETEFWIFSNSLSAASDFARFADLPESRTEIIQPPDKSPDAESMLLMTLGAALVISNSTFSWWGAYLNDETSQIISPKKWFRNLDDPTFPKKDGWKFSESIWVY
jgi:hypothetical protein